MKTSFKFILLNIYIITIIYSEEKACVAENSISSFIIKFINKNNIS